MVSSETPVVNPSEQSSRRSSFRNGPLPQFHIHQGLDPDRAGQHMFVRRAQASASVSSPERTACSCTREWSLVSN